MNKEELIKEAVKAIDGCIYSMEERSQGFVDIEELDFYEKEALQIISQIALIKVLKAQP